MPGTERRSRRHRWTAAALGAGLLLAVQLLDRWRRDHALLINTSSSLPNWAFLVTRDDTARRGDIVFFEAPSGPIIRAHFGARPRPFGKRVLGLAGDKVTHDGLTVRINGRAVARRKLRTRTNMLLAAGPTGIVPLGCYYVGTPHPDGLDSRYAAIGFVCGRQLIGTGEAVL